MLNEQPHCSETFCNIHDLGLSISDEDRKRPENRGRNPWDGFCLRLAKLKELRRSGDADRTLGEGIKLLAEVLERLDSGDGQEQQSRPRRTAPDVPEKKAVRKGGAPGL